MNMEQVKMIRAWQTQIIKIAIGLKKKSPWLSPGNAAADDLMALAEVMDKRLRALEERT